MADEEDYIDVSELKTEEQAIKDTKKENFKSKFKSAFKSASTKSYQAVEKVGQKGGELVKKGYESYKASQTPEAKKKRYEMEMQKVQQQRSLLQAKARLEKAKKSLPQPKQQDGLFGGGMGGDVFGSGSKQSKRTNNPFGGSSMSGSMGNVGNPFGGGMPGLGKGKKRKQKQQNMYNPFG